MGRDLAVQPGAGSPHLLTYLRDEEALPGGEDLEPNSNRVVAEYLPADTRIGSQSFSAPGNPHGEPAHPSLTLVLRPLKVRKRFPRAPIKRRRRFAGRSQPGQLSVRAKSDVIGYPRVIICLEALSSLSPAPVAVALTLIAGLWATRSATGFFRPCQSVAKRHVGCGRGPDT